MTNWIWITTQFEGYHSYPDAPIEVDFLRNEHRHIFHVKVSIEIKHDNREIEFIIFKRFINGIFETWSRRLGHYSCEMMANDLYESIKNKYEGRKVKIEISENGENGVVMEYD